MAAKKLSRRVAARSLSASFRRRAETRSPRTTVLIVCEGYKSEYHYFVELRRSLNLSNATVEIPRNDYGSAPISVVQFAESRHRETTRGYDQVFCVFDRDAHESYRRALQAIEGMATRKRDPIPMRGIPSIPCFEFWVLLHFARTDQPFGQCDAVIAAVRQHRPGYQKGDANFFAEIVPHADVAVANARWVVERQQAAGTVDPCTHVHEVVEYLKSIAAPAGSTQLPMQFDAAPT